MTGETYLTGILSPLAKKSKLINCYQKLSKKQLDMSQLYSENMGLDLSILKQAKLLRLFTCVLLLLTETDFIFVLSLTTCHVYLPRATIRIYTLSIFLKKLQAWEYVCK